MSWSIMKVSDNKEALKASIQRSEDVPQVIRDEICKRIDETHIQKVADDLHSPYNAIFVESSGHLGPLERPWENSTLIRIVVWRVEIVHAVPGSL